MKLENLKKKIETFTADDAFGLTFKKANGETREYGDCRVGVHIVNENATRHGLSAKEQGERGNLLFYTSEADEGKGGYRIAKWGSITEFKHGGKTYKIEQ